MIDIGLTTGGVTLAEQTAVKKMVMPKAKPKAKPKKKSKKPKKKCARMPAIKKSTKQTAVVSFTDHGESKESLEELVSEACVELISKLNPSVHANVMSLPTELWPRSVKKHGGKSYSVHAECGARVTVRANDLHITIERTCQGVAPRNTFSMIRFHDKSIDVRRTMDKLCYFACKPECSPDVWKLWK